MFNLIKKIIKLNGNNLSYYENCNQLFCFGYTENGWKEKQIEQLFVDRKLLFLKQVHQSKIVEQSQYYDEIEADGIFLNKNDAVAIIKTADCLPVFFYGNNFAGLIHAGWRGISQGIVETMLALIDRQRLSETKFVLGAAIEQDCYEIQADVLKIFLSKFPDKKNEIVKEKNGRYYLGLKAAVKNILFSNGIRPLQIFEVERCTFCDLKLPSYRRQKDQAGRIYNFIYLK